uniref:Rho guanine nucleotide exchange factor 3 n=1 Tax=Astyanax mexicanus TaxID=7994 RepID=A0A8B9JBR7_ASTMX
MLLSCVSLMKQSGPCNKRVKPVDRSSEVTGIITPVKTPALKRLGQSIQVRRTCQDALKTGFFHQILISVLLKLYKYEPVFFASFEFPCLEAYITYCCNQVGAKALLDQKKQVRRVEEFLRLCQESSFSRKLDLWNFLDLPRSRLVKYPLLLKEIQKTTPADHPDEETLPQAMELIQNIITEVNQKTGEAECQFYRRGLSYPEEGQRVSEIQASRFLYCHGELKNTKGQKLHVFLFERVLVLTRPVVQDKDGTVQFQVYRQPLPAAQILLEDLPDGEASSSGSFRGAFTGNDKVKNCFRVSSRGRSTKGQSHSLQANDSFNKQQWISCLRQAIVQSRDRFSQDSQSKASSRLSPDPALDHIAELSLNSDVEMPDT